MKYLSYLLMWAFEFGVLFLLYRFVLSDVQGIWFFVFTGAFIFGYILYHFGQYYDWKKERMEMEMIEKKFS